MSSMYLLQKNESSSNTSRTKLQAYVVGMHLLCNCVHKNMQTFTKCLHEYCAWKLIIKCTWCTKHAFIHVHA